MGLEVGAAETVRRQTIWVGAAPVVTNTSVCNHPRREGKNLREENRITIS